MAEEKILLDIQINYASLAKQLDDTKGKVDQLKVQAVQLKGALAQAKLGGDPAEIQKLNVELLKNQAQTKAIQQEQKNLEKQSVTLTQAINAEEGSYEELYRTQVLREIALKTMAETLQVNSKGELELTDQYKQQAAEVLKGKEALLQFNAGIKDGRLNVGNYADGFEKAIEKTGIFRGSLGQLRDVFEQSKAGFDAVKKGGELIVDGFEKGKNAVKAITVEIGNSISVFNNLSSTTQSAGDAVTETATAINDTSEAAKGLGDSGKLAGEGISLGAEAGSKGMSLLKVAIASTGIGLLLIAAGALFAFFKKNEEAAEFLERVFAGLGAVVDVLIDGFANLGKFIFEAFSNPKKALSDLATLLKENILNRFIGIKDILVGIATLDFKQLTNGIGELTTGVNDLEGKLKNAAASAKEYGERIAQAARESAALKKAEQDLDTTLRNQSVAYNNQANRIAEIQKLLKDKNLTDQERLRLGREAITLQENLTKIDQSTAREQKRIALDRLTVGKDLSDQEKQRFNELLTIQRTRTELENQELERLRSKGNIYGDDVAAFNELVNKENDTISQGNETKIRLEKEVSSAIAEERRRYLSAVIGILDDELKLRELKGVEDFELQREIENKKREELLSNTDLTAKEREKIIKDAQVRLAAIDKAEFDSKEKRIKEAADRELNLEKQVRDNILRIREAETDKGDLQAQEINKINSINNAVIDALNERRKLREQELEDNNKAVDAELELLTSSSSFKSKTAAEQSVIIGEIIKAGKDREAEIIESGELANIAILAEGASKTQQTVQGFQDEKLKRLVEQKQLELEAQGGEQSLISQQELLALQEQQDIESAQRRLGNTEDFEITKALIQEKYAQQRLLLEEKVSDQQLKGISDTLGKAAGLFKKESQAYKILATNQTLIDTYQSATASYKSLAGIPIVGPALGFTAAGLAVAAGLANVARINDIKLFADGGDTMEYHQAIKKYNPSYVGSFKSGGNIQSASIGIIGEAGSEYVSPNWMVSHPKLKNTFNTLEQIRQTRVIPFAEGGTTSSLPFADAAFRSQSLTVPVIDSANAQLIVDAINNQPQKVVVLDEVNAGLVNKVKVESRGTF